MERASFTLQSPSFFGSFLFRLNFILIIWISTMHLWGCYPTVPSTLEKTIGEDLSTSRTKGGPFTNLPTLEVHATYVTSHHIARGHRTTQLPPSLPVEAKGCPPACHHCCCEEGWVPPQDTLSLDALRSGYSQDAL
ncbi:neuropeptide S isoform X1 [Mauremys reevesii]|uniref:neuropeptide S isoform X1 n=1 Tax=Mauremys reevesii TaxID=260615 RepID=UPI00193F1033|nr:neuropeptide S isoform X1 [Mauremys reevesii]XP_039402353.1 neuropeptide S isoform X1 [Mauremys reevesii]XP_039402354.1 neuropeptide S isoform X1 [Mauremys reevesii]XP_039402355.1 neuropeptide S isoform X1 [Mauremys reevesii]